MLGVELMLGLCEARLGLQATICTILRSCSPLLKWNRLLPALGRYILGIWQDVVEMELSHKDIHPPKTYKLKTTFGPIKSLQKRALPDTVLSIFQLQSD